DSIVIDPTAAGWGWFIDVAPSNDSAFNGQRGNEDGLKASSSSPANGHLDLLTVFMHELGHLVGLPDLPSSGPSQDLMNVWLAPGPRRLPSDPVSSVVSVPNAVVAPTILEADRSASLQATHGAGELPSFITGLADAGVALRVLERQSST